MGCEALVNSEVEGRFTRRRMGIVVRNTWWVLASSLIFFVLDAIYDDAATRLAALILLGTFMARLIRGLLKE